jgi:hypothetical protein
MSLSVLILLDTSNSMNDPFGGLEDTTKFKAVTEAFKGFFESVSRKTDTNQIRFGIFSYSTPLVRRKILYNEIYPMTFFPPVPDIDDLTAIRPNGDSPLFEAVEKGVGILSVEDAANKIMIIVTGDSLSNYVLRADRLDGVVEKLRQANIRVSLLQSGHAEKDGFNFFVEKFGPVLMQPPFPESRIASSVEQMRKYLEALTEKKVLQ